MHDRGIESNGMCAKDHDQEIAMLENIISFLKVATIQHEIDISIELAEIRTVIEMLKKRDAQTGI